MAADPAAALPSVPVSDGWAVWELAALRGAGLPAGLAGRLRGPAPADISAFLRDMVRDEPFMHALTWQNPGLVDNWVARYADGDGTLDRRARREAVLAHYLQRYAVKNDTIGSFGPVGWARLDPGASGLTSIPGRELIRRAEVFFESWPIEQLAAAWSADPRVRRHIPPYRAASSWLDGRTLHRLRGRPVRLLPEEAAVLGACDGRRTATGIADLLRRTDGPSLTGTEVSSVLHNLARRGLLRWEIVFPVDDHPERHLARWTATVDDAALRAELDESLAGLERHRAAVAAARSDHRRLHAALREAGDHFAKVLGRGGRSKTEAANSRGFLYEDCLRDAEVTVGGPLLDALTPVLDLVLTSCRWLTHQVAHEFRAMLRARHAELVGDGGEVDFRSLFWAVSTELRGESSTVLPRVRDEFWRRWRTVCGPAPAEGPWRLEARRLAPLVAEQFAAPHAGWAAARFHSPDVMLAADGPQAAARGEFRWVLGELHMAVNTLENRVFARSVPDPAALHAAVRRDSTPGRLVPVLSRSWPDVGPRTYPPLAVHLPDRYRYWSFEDDEGTPDGTPSIPIMGLTAYRAGSGDIRVRHRAGGFDVDAVDLLGEFLSFLVADHFSVLPTDRGSPRLTVDDVVVSRTRWLLPTARLSGATGGRYRTTDVAAQLRELGVPPVFFAKFSTEPKPIYVDAESDLLMRNFLRIARQSSSADAAATVALTEMLPDLDELWLEDAGGERYTSELRLVAVDRIAYPALGGSSR